jgi:hypothetical protein
VCWTGGGGDETAGRRRGRGLVGVAGEAGEGRAVGVAASPLRSRRHAGLRVGAATGSYQGPRPRP